MMKEMNFHGSSWNPNDPYTVQDTSTVVDEDLAHHSPSSLTPVQFLIKRQKQRNTSSSHLPWKYGTSSPAQKGRIKIWKRRTASS